jgi:hypothetical protein
MRDEWPLSPSSAITLDFLEFDASNGFPGTRRPVSSNPTHARARGVQGSTGWTVGCRI